MIYNLFKYIPVLMLTLFMLPGYGQHTGLIVSLNKTFFKPGDTILVNASLPSIKTNATLFVEMVDEKGSSWELRWPMLKGKTAAALLIPDSFPTSRYRLNFTVLQNLFTIRGKVKNPAGTSSLQTALITAEADILEAVVPVDSAGNFTFKNVLFAGDATIVFSLAEKRRKDYLDIAIETVLDSAVLPRTIKSIETFIGYEEPTEEAQAVVINSDLLNAAAQTLETVTVTAMPLNRGELFNKNYSSGLFRDINERIINLLDDTHYNNAFSVIQIVRQRVPGLIITNFPTPVVSWRSSPVQFYVDEIRTPIEFVDVIPVSDVAIIKAYPPPFFGNIGGNGGAVAIYTKRGGFTDDNYRNAFKVKGYTKLFAELPATPGSL